MQSHRTTALKSFHAIADTVIAGSMIVGVFTLANWGSHPEGMESFLKARVTVGHAIQGAAFLLAFHFIFDLLGVYDASRLGFRQEIPRILAATTLASLFALIFPAMSVTRAFSWTLVFSFWIATVAALIWFRAIARGVTKYLVSKPREVVIVGSGPRALHLYKEIQASDEPRFRVLGFVDSPNQHPVPEEVERRMLGSLDQLDSVLMKRVVDHVLIALPVKSCYDDIQRTIAVCEKAGVESEYLADVFDLSFARAEQGNLDTHPVVRCKVVQDDYRLMIKRGIDIIGAASGLILLSPLLLIVAVAVALSSPGPVLFAQERYGLNKRRFRMYKFRTMVQDAEALQSSLETRNEANGPVFKIRNDPRVTRLGRFLRKTSMDELPQFFNVLRGEMSLVGPRPLPFRDVSRFDKVSLMRRFSVKPGITCSWQIVGRSNLSFERWIEMDLAYIDNWSLRNDLAILLRTVPALLRSEGAV